MAKSDLSATLLNHSQNHKENTSLKELLALATFTSHFRHNLLGQQFTIITDHSALQWLHSFNDADGKTARWLEKRAPFEYKVRHRPGKSNGHASSLSLIPQTLSMRLKITLFLPRLKRTPHVGPTINSYQEVTGNVFDSKISIAHSVSADFKMCEGVAQHFKRMFSSKYPSHPDHSLTPLWRQRLPERRPCLYHVVRKRKYFHKPTYSTLRASLERMRAHAENNSISTNMPCIGTGLDNLGWDRVKLAIHETFRTLQCM